MDLTRRTLIATGLAAAATPASAADLVPADALLADVALIERVYGALHPGLYRYNTPAQMARRFGQAKAAFDRPRSRGEAFVELARLTAGIKCGHTYPNPYNQSEAVSAELFGGRDRLPFHFAWIGGRMVVLKDLTGEAGLARGSEILAIGGRPVGDLLKALMPLSRADGSNDAKRIRNLEVRDEGRFDAFDVYAQKLLPALRDRVSLSVRAPGGRARSMSVALMTAAERMPFRPPEPQGATPVWRLERRPDGVAVLTMPNWALYDSDWDWKAWLNEQLDRLSAERAPALIIDLRGNEGGLDCGDLIVARRIETALTPRPQQRMTRYRKTPDELNRYLETWDRSFRDWGADAVGPDAKGFYALKSEADEVIQPSARPFKGRMVVLADASNSSATFQFGQAVKDFRLGRIVGQTSGGNRRGINGGAFFFLKLPGSGLEVDVPLIARFPTTPQPDAGVAPDIAVRPSARAIAEGRDQEMAAALKALG